MMTDLSTSYKNRNTTQITPKNTDTAQGESTRSQPLPLPGPDFTGRAEPPQGFFPKDFCYSTSQQSGMCSAFAAVTVQS